MKRIVLSAAAALAALVSAAQTSIDVEVHNIVGLDERFNVTFTIEGESSPSSFEWSPTDDFQLVWGPQKGSSTSVRMVNGKVSKSSQTTYTYILMPKRTGSFVLPAATAKVKGKTISSRQATVEVVSNGQGASASGGAPSSGSGSPSGGSARSVSGDDIFLRFTLSKTRAVIGEPITATLKIYQRANIRGFEDAKFPAFNGFWSQETEAPTNIEFRREQVGDRIYDAAVLRRYVLIPQKTGDLVIDPSEIVCLVNVKNNSSTGSSIFDSFFEDQYITVRRRVASAAATVHVSPLPAGAPASFSGGVGDFKIAAKVSKDSLKTHEAASLLVTVSGKGNVALLEAPKISFPPDFEVYDVKATQSTDKSGTSGSKTFEYPFIPRSHGDFTLAPVTYSYYNVNTGKYVTVQSEAMPLQVARGTGPASAAETGGSQLAVERKGVKNLGEDIRFIRTRRPAFRSEHGFFVHSSLYWILAAAAAAAAAAIWLSLRQAAALRADVVGTKNRRATQRALKRLKTAESFLKQNLYTAFYEELHRALLGFVSDKLNMDMAEQNKENISKALQEGGADEGLIREFTDLLDACEFARYSPDAGHEAMNAHYESAVRVISSIDAGMKRKPVSLRGASALMALLLTLPWAFDAAAEETGYLDSLWTRGVEAYTAGEWTAAKDCWQGILDAGVETSELYYNAGNAYFKDGNYPRAILNYERALKLNPSDSDARYNLDLANSFIQDKIDPVPEFFLETWARKFNYTFKSDVWAALSLVFLGGMLAMLLLFLLSGKPGLRRTGFYSAIVLLLLTLLSWDFASWQYRDYVQADGAIVLRAVSSVKSAPSGTAAKDLFILHEGTKVKILDSVGDWYNISLADGRQGWIESADVEII